MTSRSLSITFIEEITVIVKFYYQNLQILSNVVNFNKNML